MEQAALLTDLNKDLSHSDLEATLSCVNTVKEEKSGVDSGSL